jgi:hypothetical protein
MKKKPSLGMCTGFACGVSVMAMLSRFFTDPTFPLSAAERDRMVEDFERAAEAKAVESGVPLAKIQLHRHRQYLLMLSFLNDVLQRRGARLPKPGELN